MNAFIRHLLKKAPNFSRGELIEYIVRHGWKELYSGASKTAFHKKGVPHVLKVGAVDCDLNRMPANQVFPILEQVTLQNIFQALMVQEKAELTLQQIGENWRGFTTKEGKRVGKKIRTLETRYKMRGADLHGWNFGRKNGNWLAFDC